MANDPTFRTTTGVISVATTVTTTVDDAPLRYLKVEPTVAGAHTLEINGGSNAHAFDATSTAPIILDLTHLEADSPAERTAYRIASIVITPEAAPAPGSDFIVTGHV